jgi:predicted metal-binding protein
MDEPDTPARQTLVCDVLVLVCKDCRKRSSGPETKTKKLAAGLRSLAKDSKLKARVVTTSCLGLCPKKATAVALVPRGEALRAMAVVSLSQLKDFSALL